MARTERAAEGKEPYYGLPMLKPPVWRWEIATYLFLGGLSGGSFALARLARRSGGEPARRVATVGTFVSLAALAPSPLLLIKDLGVPRRFAYMLRVWKPGSPMNLGSWLLTGFGAIVSLASLLELLGGERGARSGRALRRLGLAVAELCGVPLGLMLAGYTPVLLSTTATPLWSRSLWLGPLFSASAIHTAADGIELVSRLGARTRRASRTLHALRRISRIASAAEAVSLFGYLIEAGPLARPIVRGRLGRWLWGGAVALGLIAPEILQRVPVRSARAERWLRVTSSALGLLGGYALRWAILHGGHPSSQDPESARRVSRRRDPP
ncbi:MAG: NrfD/PsrC family molybdoenzyme membrane anchor subunit [Polyangia bacterium]